MTFDLENYAGRRIEVELNGQRIRGRVVRGPARQPVLLEERGTVGDEKSDTHERLRMLRTWKPKDLVDAELVGVVEGKEEKPAKPTRRQRSREWSETVALAEADPAQPPSDWEGGLLAWSEVVYAARRKVERSRKAMMKALREAAG